MSQQIPTAYVKKYAAGVRMLQQQTGTRLRGAVMFDGDVTADRAFYDQIDATSMSEITNRHGDTEYTDTPHKRRMATLKPYEVADLVDRADQRRLLNDPINPYTRAMAAAANRKTDDIIITSFRATAATGVDGSGTADLAATNFTQHDGTAVDGTGLAITLAGLLDARETLEAAENEEDDEDNKWYCATFAAVRTVLLQITDVTSADFNTVKALVNGQIDQYLGFTWLKSERLETSTTGAATARHLPFWVKKSVQLAVSQNATAFMDVLPQKRHSTQVRYEMDAGAVRMDEKGVYLMEVTAAG